MGRKKTSGSRGVHSVSEEELQEAGEEVVADDGASLVGMEANLEVPPIFVLGKNEGQRRFAECTMVVRTPEGQRIEQYWRISIPEPYTLPGSFDQDVWVAVQALINRRGGMPPDGKLYFSMYELLEIMGRDHRGRHYDQLQHSLERLASTTFHSDNAFYSADVGSYERVTFHPWAVSFSGSYNRRSGRAAERHELEFHSLVRRSFQSQYLKLLDADFYYSLKFPLAKRLFRLVDRKRGGKRTWSSGVTKLQELMPLAESYRYPSKIKEVLQPAHKELVERGFLEEVSYEKSKTGERVRYRVSAQWDRRRGLNGAENELSDYESRVSEMLLKSGVWSNVAPDLVRRHGPEVCARYANALPEMRGVEDPGAWLRWAIETGFVLPNHLQTQPSLLGDSREPPSDEGVQGRFGAPNQGQDQEQGAEHSAPAPPEPDEGAERVWHAALERAGLDDDRPSIGVWFESCVPTAFDGTTLTLVVPNGFAKDYIENRFKESLQRSLRHDHGHGARLAVVAARSHPDPQ